MREQHPDNAASRIKIAHLSLSDISLTPELPSMMTPEDSVRRLHEALRRMLIRYPYHAAWLNIARWRPLSSVGTMAVMLRKGQPCFFYSPLFLTECDDEEIEGVIHHELNHLVFGHPRIDHAKYPNHQALTIAEEVTVNEHVPERLPGTPLLLEQFPELPPGEDTLARYRRLENRSDLENKAQTLDTHALWDRATNAESIDAAKQQIRQVLMQQMRTRNHRESMRNLMRGVADFDRGEMLREIRASLEPSRPVHWNKILARLTGHEARRLSTYHRPSRRIADSIGIVPGSQYKADLPRVLAAIDTSSSMQRRHFERIRRELDALMSLARITVIQCDKQIRDTYRMTRPLESITGRGGTDLRPPFEPSILQAHKPKLLLYFTDGDGPVPDHPPSIPVLWCLLAGGKRPTSWGEVITLD